MVTALREVSVNTAIVLFLLGIAIGALLVGAGATIVGLSFLAIQYFPDADEVSNSSRFLNSSSFLTSKLPETATKPDLRITY